jgi:hypothetical protein
MNEHEARVWIRKIVEVIRTGTTLTPITADDKVCDMLLLAVDNDVIWPWVWSLLRRALERDDDGIIVGDEPEPVAAAELGIDPFTIYKLITLVIAIWKLTRK